MAYNYTKEKIKSYDPTKSKTKIIHQGRLDEKLKGQMIDKLIKTKKKGYYSIQRKRTTKRLGGNYRG